MSSNSLISNVYDIKIIKRGLFLKISKIFRIISMKLYMCLKEADLFIHFFFIQSEADTKIKRVFFFYEKN